MEAAAIFPIQGVRAAFPALSGDPAPIFLDNPAGTRVPASVGEAAATCLTRINANLGGHFAMSAAASEIVEAAHASMAIFLNAASAREIIIGPSMTSLTFALSRSLAHELSAGDEIIVTRFDHDGNIAPWLAIAQEREAVVRWLPFDPHTFRVEPEALAAALSERTKIVALGYASNITGSINDVSTLVSMAKDAGALVYLDAVQFAPHDVVDARAIGCDALLCSSYKFYGPHLGIAYVREELLERLQPYKVRPATMDLPYRFETGTPQIEQLAALDATVRYIERLSGDASATDRRTRIRSAFGATTAWESSLAQQLIDGLQAIDGLTLHGVPGADPKKRVPTVSFTHDSRSSDAIAAALAARGICIWSGNNYALETVRSLGLDEDDGVLRIGIAHYNTPEELDLTLSAIKETLENA